MSAKKGEPKIIWNDQEIEAVVKEALGIYFSEKVNIWRYIAVGQKILPKERQRKISSQSLSKKIMDLFVQRREDTFSENLPSEIPIEVPVPKEVLVERPLAETLEKASTEELLVALARRCAPLVDRFNSVIQRFEKPQKPNRVITERNTVSDEHATQEKTKKTKVLLFGFLEGQKRDILEKASGFNLELIFRDKDHGTSDQLPLCRYCIVLKMVSHSDWNKLKAKFACKEKGHIKYVNGISEALKKLADINSLVATGI